MLSSVHHHRFSLENVSAFLHKNFAECSDTITVFRSAGFRYRHLWHQRSVLHPFVLKQLVFVRDEFARSVIAKTSCQPYKFCIPVSQSLLHECLIVRLYLSLLICLSASFSFFSAAILALLSLKSISMTCGGVLMSRRRWRSASRVYVSSIAYNVRRCFAGRNFRRRQPVDNSEFWEFFKLSIFFRIFEISWIKLDRANRLLESQQILAGYDMRYFWTDCSVSWLARHWLSSPHPMRPSMLSDRIQNGMAVRLTGTAELQNDCTFFTVQRYHCVCIWLEAYNNFSASW